jgi:putative aldouronate transport system substrate-binding protein
MKKLIAVLFILSVATSAFAAGSQQTTGGLREYDVFLGYEKDDYPQDGTIFGDWLEEQTGVRINWEFIVGDLQQKVGLIAASGDYPDAIHPRNYTEILLGANALIPLNELVDDHGPNIAAMYGDRIEMIKQEDGNLYWFPQVMPYGDEYRNPNPGHGLYVQEAVLEAWDYQIPENFEEAVDLLIEYAEDNPTINGNRTFAFTGQYDTWRWFGTSNIPHILSGHPNDGSLNVDLVNGRWVASHYWATDDEYNSYRILNKAHLAGLYDTESFVMSYDQYIAKLSGGNILGFYDQDWNFSQAQNLLLDQNEGRWYVALPVMLDGYDATILNPPAPQVSEGIGISVDASDPEGLMEYFDFLAERDTLVRRSWGREGVDYMVDENGVFYRTEAQIDQWRDQDWRNEVYGADYWSNFLRIDSGSVIWDGINNYGTDTQPSLYKASKLPQEIAALDNLGVDTFAELFPPANLDRSSYFPAWTITIPPDSDEGIFRQRVDDIRRKHIPLLIMAEAGQYDAAWDAYNAELSALGQAGFQRDLEFFQAEIDRRVEVAGGY